MKFVLAALSRPLTVIVALVAVALCAVLALKRMPVDIFPQVGDPAIYVAQPYSGMDPAQMEGYMTYYYEYHFLYITGIDHVESKSIQGAALMKLVFHEGTNMASAMAETIGYVNRARAFMPPGTVPPFVTRFDAGSVAVGLLTFNSATRSQGELQDIAINRVRPLFATLPGVSAPPPFGGNQRTIVITLNPDKLRQYQISPEEAIAAVSKATLVMPSGNMWTGDVERIARTNAALGANLQELMNAPLKPVAGTAVYLRDIGTIENGTDIVSAYAHVNGKRTVYIPVTKRADASTLDVINAVKAAIPSFQKVVPDDVNVRLEFDQSPIVIDSIHGLLWEGLFGAALTGLMVLIFLRDWRSALIVVTNIPFALLAALVMLWAAGQSVNIMTLGGLALAVGVLVDEATVEIENIHSRMLPGVSRARAVLEACSRTALARLLSMFCVLAVLVPAFFMVGAARQLFVPLSLAVAFSMVSSYFLSSSLVPVLSIWLMKETHRGEEREGVFGRFRSAYDKYLAATLRIRVPLAVLFLGVSIALVWAFLPRIGREIFPDTSARFMRIRMRAPTGTRIEVTERLLLKALAVLNREIGPNNVQITSDFLGLIPSSYPVDLIHLFTSGPHEAIIQVALKPEAPAGEALRERLRASLAKELPQCQFAFEAGDIVSQVMSFGSPTPIEVAVQGVSLRDDYAQAAKVKTSLVKLTFLRDLSLEQAADFPTLDINIDRDRAGQLGLTMADVASSVVPATSSSRFIQPNYWRDPNSGNAFQIQVELPQNRMQSVESVGDIPLGQNTRLRDISSMKLGTMPGLIERYNGQHVVSITANLHGITLGEAAPKIERAMQSAGEPAKGVSVKLRGEIPPLEQTLAGLRVGLLSGVLVIFLLLAANFQSVRLALAIILTIPPVLLGVLLMLWVTGTTLNVQSFMGAIMSMGIAVANSILLVTFAERARKEGLTSIEAAKDAAAGRMRAILMTAAAMIFGMLPLAIGFGEGGAQSASLGRAVVGGLLLSTFTTLTVLPGIYAIFQHHAGRTSPSLNPLDPESRYYEAQ